MARKKIIAGNWKMNMTPTEAVELINTLKPLVATEDADVVFCVPAIDIIPAVEAAKGSNIQIGAENMYFEEKGAYTGEISPAMLTDAGVKYVVLGHSERREYFAETSETVNKKMLKAFEHGITPIMCCGETLTQREQGVTMDFIRQQVKVGFLGVTAEQAATAVIAYEPIWAIGTGKTATTERSGSGGGHPHPVRRICECSYGSGAVRTAGYRRRSGGRRSAETGFRQDRQLEISLGFRGTEQAENTGQEMQKLSVRCFC